MDRRDNRTGRAKTRMSAPSISCLEEPTRGLQLSLASSPMHLTPSWMGYTRRLHAWLRSWVLLAKPRLRLGQEVATDRVFEPSHGCGTRLRWVGSQWRVTALALLRARAETQSSELGGRTSMRQVEIGVWARSHWSTCAW